MISTSSFFEKAVITQYLQHRYKNTEKPFNGKNNRQYHIKLKLTSWLMITILGKYFQRFHILARLTTSSSWIKVCFRTNVHVYNHHSKISFYFKPLIKSLTSEVLQWLIWFCLCFTPKKICQAKLPCFLHLDFMMLVFVMAVYRTDSST